MSRIIVPALILVIFNAVLYVVIDYATHLYCGGVLCPR